MLIYLLTNKINGKIYVGKHGRAGRPQRRWQEHCWDALKGLDTYLSNAIRKHGAEAFEFSILQDDITSKEDLNVAEKRFIKALRAQDRSIGYNLTAGGDGGPGTPRGTMPAETRAKISRAKKGKKNPGFAERLRVRHAAKTPQERRAAMARATSFITPEVRARIAQAFEINRFRPGERFSPATEFKKGQLGNPAVTFKPGMVPWNKGVPHRPESIQLMRINRTVTSYRKKAAKIDWPAVVVQHREGCYF